MNVAVITAALYPDRSRIHYLDESAKRNNIPLQPFGIGSPFGNWKQMLLEYTLPKMQELAYEGYTHALYVDGADSLFLATLNEIMSKIGRLPRTMCIMSGDPEPPHINAGGFFTDIAFFVQLMSELSEKYADDGDYQNWLVREWPVGGIELDREGMVFQSMTGLSHVIPVTHRMVNTITGQWPCILHFRGGYSCPKTGRDERIKPYFDKLFGAQQ